MLNDTIRVAADGTVTYGVPVPRRKNRDGEEMYLQVMPPKQAHGRRFIPAGVPRGMDLNITAPHDCDKHLTDAPPVAAFADYAPEVLTDEDGLTGEEEDDGSIT